MGRKRILVESGDVFNGLTFISEVPTDVGQIRFGIFKCDCGDISEYRITSIRQGGVKRCASCRNKLNADSNRIYPINNIFKKGFNTEDNSYILGLFYADGTIRGNDNTISLSLVEQDVKILEEITSLIQPSKPLHYCNVSNGRNQYRLSISDSEIRGLFVNSGCVRNKSLTLKYPNIEIVDKDFIRGYIDGDGHISRKQLSIMGTREFLEEVKLRFEQISGEEIKVRWYQKNKETNCWQMSVSYLQDRYLILNWIYDKVNLKLERKYMSYVNNYRSQK